jgi:riboflavin synthase
MFTGIIEEIGKVEQTSFSGGNLLLRINAPRVSEGLKLGDSVNINGACQTVVESGKGFFVVEAVAETLKRTNLDQLRVGDAVNLERALGASDRLGGHLVTGHIDFVGQVKSIIQKGESYIFEFSFPEEYRSHFVEKGSVAVDGISLTIVDVLDNSFTVSVIPFTTKSTTFGTKAIGDWVNIETDLIGKYIRKTLTVEQGKSKITEKWLKEKGF